MVAEPHHIAANPMKSGTIVTVVVDAPEDTTVKGVIVLAAVT